MIAPSAQRCRRSWAFSTAVEVARRYIRRLAVEPYLGVRVERGLPAEYGCRPVHRRRVADQSRALAPGAHYAARQRGDLPAARRA